MLDKELLSQTLCPPPHPDPSVVLLECVTHGSDLPESESGILQRVPMSHSRCQGVSQSCWGHMAAQDLSQHCCVHPRGICRVTSTFPAP